MYKTVCFSILLACVVITYAYKSIWTIRYRSHPYKTQIYTAEFIEGSRRYFWCADYIHLEDAVVLCNQASEYNGLGPYDITSAWVEFGALDYNPAEQQYFTNETFACVGNETRLSACPLVSVTERCPSGYLGKVDCHPADNARKNLTVSLTSLPQLSEMGAVKVENPSLESMAGLICVEDGSWSHNEATVVCKSLGFDFGWQVDAPLVANVTSLPQSYVMKNVHCDGTETSINNCPHTDMCQAIDYLSRNFMCPEQCSGDIAAVLCG
ncbi:lysyl oxidase [Elysia marginata]|uniref:Lysyl oxidase n=1 Tax=Elysia marginata TaxID=1093978 RepID=A0AAV4HXZ4_9GAST|nr:lysyl oxidase [Elysia marginata]